MFLKQYYLNCLAHASYLIGDAASGTAVVVDPQRDVGRYVEDLRSQGFSPDEVARIRSPLGLDLGGRDPERIALSIAAGVVAAANGRDGGWLDR